MSLLLAVTVTATLTAFSVLLGYLLGARSGFARGATAQYISASKVITDLQHHINDLHGLVDSQQQALVDAHRRLTDAPTTPLTPTEFMRLALIEEALMEMENKNDD